MFCESHWGMQDQVVTCLQNRLCARILAFSGGNPPPPPIFEFKKVFVERHDVSSASRGLVDMVSASVFNLRSLLFCPELHPVSVVALSSHLFGNLLEHLLALVRSKDLLLGLLLAPEGYEIPHLHNYPILCDQSWESGKVGVGFAMVFGHAHVVLVSLVECGSHCEDIGGCIWVQVLAHDSLSRSSLVFPLLQSDQSSTGQPAPSPLNSPELSRGFYQMKPRWLAVPHLAPNFPQVST